MKSSFFPDWCSSWLAYIGILCGLAALALSSFLVRRQAQVQLQTTTIARVELTQVLGKVRDDLPIAARDFVENLPRAIDAQGTVDTLHRAARESGVLVTSLSLREVPARADQLGRQEMTVVAQGTYAALKMVLAEWLARFPSATVRAQQWRRVESNSTPNAASVVVEANWSLSVWTRPLGFDAGSKLVPKAMPAAASAQVAASSP